MGELVGGCQRQEDMWARAGGRALPACHPPTHTSHPLPPSLAHRKVSCPAHSSPLAPTKQTSSTARGSTGAWGAPGKANLCGAVGGAGGGEWRVSDGWWGRGGQAWVALVAGAQMHASPAQLPTRTTRARGMGNEAWPPGAGAARPGPTWVEGGGEGRVGQAGHAVAGQCCGRTAGRRCLGRRTPTRPDVRAGTSLPCPRSACPAHRVGPAAPCLLLSPQHEHNPTPPPPPARRTTRPASGTPRPAARAPATHRGWGRAQGWPAGRRSRWRARQAACAPRGRPSWAPAEWAAFFGWGGGGWWRRMWTAGLVLRRPRGWRVCVAWPPPRGGCAERAERQGLRRVGLAPSGPPPLPIQPSPSDGRP